MLIGKPKPAFRLKLTEIDTRRSKTVTLYQGKEKKTIEQTLSQIIESLRMKE